VLIAEIRRCSGGRPRKPEQAPATARGGREPEATPRRGVAFLSPLILATLTVTSAAQTLPQPATDCAARVGGEPVFLNPYVQIVTLYRQGDLAGARRQMTELGEESVTEVVERLEGLNDSVRQGDRGTSLPSDECLAGAALVHGELGMSATRDTYWAKADYHLRRARILFGLMHEPEPFRRDWLLALAYFYQSAIFASSEKGDFGQSSSEFVDEHGVGYFNEARSYFEEALELYPEDLEILVAAGGLYEWGGSPRFGEEKHLKTAEKLYRRATVVNPRVAETQLRHGRVLEKLERYDEAVGPLERVIELAENDVLDYLAHLILGGIEERSGRLGKAIERYRAATEVLPGWQVAHIALAHALHSSGQRRASWSALARSVDAPPANNEARVGWWAYELGRSQKLEPLLERLRERVYF